MYKYLQRSLFYQTNKKRKYCSDSLVDEESLLNKMTIFIFILLINLINGQLDLYLDPISIQQLFGILYKIHFFFDKIGFFL